MPIPKGYALEWEEPNYYILSKRNSLYYCDNIGGKLVHILDFPCSIIKILLSKIRIFQRLFRFLFYNVLKLPNGDLFITFGDEIAFYSNKKIEKINVGKNNFRVLRSGCAYDNNGSVIFGEYHTNKFRNKMNIYRFDIKTKKLSIIYTFKENSIRHIHGIYYDKYSGRLWCVTGDENHECKILSSSDYFKTVDVFGEGDESWRCVSLIFTKKYIYYGTDSEFQQNFIYKIDRKSLNREVLSKVNGPVYYSKNKTGKIAFATTAEIRSDDNESKFKGTSPAIYIVNKEDKVELVFSSKKDNLSPIIFMPGSIHFSQGDDGSNNLYFYCVAISRLDNLSFSLKI